MTNSFRIFTISMIFLVIGGCVSSEGLLRGRVYQYYANWDPRIMWQLSSEHFRKMVAETEQEYVESLEKNNYLKEFEEVTSSIVDMSITGNKARVKMRFQGKVIATGKRFDDILYDYWVFEHGNWYMNQPSRAE